MHFSVLTEIITPMCMFMLTIYSFSGMLYALDTNCELKLINSIIKKKQFKDFGERVYYTWILEH